MKSEKTLFNEALLAQQQEIESLKQEIESLQNAIDTKAQFIVVVMARNRVLKNQNDSYAKLITHLYATLSLIRHAATPSEG